MTRVEHYKKKGERENMNKLLSLLRQHGQLRFPEIREKLGVSAPTLSSYLKELEDSKKIESFHNKGKDRRYKWYRIKPDNAKIVEAQLGKYEAIRFIEGISNPIYSYEQDRKGEKAIAAFASRIDQRVDGLAKRVIDQMVKQYLKVLAKVTMLLPNQKLAVVLMVKGKGESGGV